MNYKIIINSLLTWFRIKRQLYITPVPSNTRHSISFAITVCNEAEEIHSLIQHLLPYLDGENEIVIQADYDHVTEDVKRAIQKYESSDIRYIEFPLEHDFATAKNHLNIQCRKEYIFQLDADEIPPAKLLENLQNILAANQKVELFKLPRYNVFNNFENTPIETGIHWPDYQGRLYKNISSRIYWQRPIHERIHGYRTYTYLPANKEIAIIHNKNKEKDHIKWVTWDMSVQESNIR